MISRLRILMFPLVVLSFTSQARATTVMSNASCSGGQITFRWTSHEKGADELPAWTGYDVVRRPSNGCGPLVRVNAMPIPRTPGATHEHTLVDTPPDLETTYEYRVVRVDDARQSVSCPVELGYCFGSALSDWVSCPDQSAPAVRGKLVDWGANWLFVEPCPGSCYSHVYLSDDYGTLREELAPYVGTEMAFYGDVFCGTVEGCGMTVARYESAACRDIVPVRAPSWAAVKILYR